MVAYIDSVRFASKIGSQALALRRDDIFTSEMLQKALNELFNGSDLDSILRK